jgi:hypothetical protein
MHSRTGNSVENSNNNNYLHNNNSNNSTTSPILVYNRHSSRQSSVNLNSSYTNPQSQFHSSQNSQTISINNDASLERLNQIQFPKLKKLILQDIDFSKCQQSLANIIKAKKYDVKTDEMI